MLLCDEIVIFYDKLILHHGREISGTFDVVNTLKIWTDLTQAGLKFTSLCWLIPWLTIIVRMSNYTHCKIWDEITDLYSNFNGATVEVWNGKVISSHTLLGMWLLIHAGIKVNPC